MLSLFLLIGKESVQDMSKIMEAVAKEMERFDHMQSQTVDGNTRHNGQRSAKLTDTVAEQTGNGPVVSDDAVGLTYQERLQRNERISATERTKSSTLRQQLLLGNKLAFSPLNSQPSLSYPFIITVQPNQYFNSVNKIKGKELSAQIRGQFQSHGCLCWWSLRISICTCLAQVRSRK